MTAHELMIETNRYLIKDGILTNAQKHFITDRLLEAKSTADQARRFYRSVRFPNNTDEAGRRMYPLYFIPPYNDGKKYKTLFNQTPKTHIFSANMYELEILRLLYVLAPDNAVIGEMTAKTLERLKTTCFGNADDGVGECFDTSLVVLRFLATAAPGETEWIQSRIDNYNRHYADKKRPWYCLWYYWLCLSELSFEIARPEVDRYKNEMLHWLCHKSCVMNSEHDRTVHPVLFFMLRNNILRYDEYEYIKDRQPYISERDGRLYFDMKK